MSAYEDGTHGFVNVGSSRENCGVCGGPFRSLAHRAPSVVDQAKAIILEDATPELVRWVARTEAQGNGIWVTGSQGEVAFQIIDEPGDPVAFIVYVADRDFEVANWVLEVAL